MSWSFKNLMLGASGAILGMIGGALLFAPRAFLKASEIIVARDPNLMSEIAAPSGILLITGALMIAGATKQRFANLGLVTGAMVYGSYGVGRLISMVIHGLPSESLIAATIVELAIAAVLAALRLSAPASESIVVNPYSSLNNRLDTQL